MSVGPDSDTPPIQPPEKPLAEASVRLAQQTRDARLADLAEKKTVADNSRMLAPGIHKTSFAAGMVAAGVTKAKTVDVLGGRRDNLGKALRPHALVIQTVRDRLKRRKMLRMQKVEAELWPRIQKEVKSGDAKDVDALARAAMNFEKIQAQVSGEGQQINLHTEGDPLVDLRILISQILGDTTK